MSDTGPRRTGPPDWPGERRAQRVRITSPRMWASRQPVAHSAAREIDAQTQLGEVLLRTLMHAQLRLALFVLGGAVVLLGGLPLLFAVEPRLRSWAVLGVPVPWLLLGALVYPGLCLTGWLFVRAAERTERDFVEIVGRR